MVYVKLFEDNGADNDFSLDSEDVNITYREYHIGDWYLKTNNGEGWDWLYSYDLSTRTYYIPEADLDITDRYSLYTFNGEKFVYTRKDGGFWLHPSIRNFEFLEYLFCTKDYRIRIDRMPDGTYRYTSWKQGVSMEDIPDIVIYNGAYDEEESIYSFENNGYRYQVDYAGNGSKLSVFHNSKRVVYQEQVIE